MTHQDERAREAAPPFNKPFRVIQSHDGSEVADEYGWIVSALLSHDKAQWLCDRLNFPTAQPMAGEDVREAFEAAVIEREGDGTVIRGLLADLDHDGGYHNGEIHDEWLIWQAAWQAALAWQARAAQAPADGWVLVPREPDDGMIEAGYEALIEGREWGKQQCAADVYAAMLQSAPKP